MSTALNDISVAWAPLPKQESTQRFSIAKVNVSSFHQDIKFQKQCSTSSKRPLRVVRILEADHVPANVGRMMISGRMADVCAELDRLAARETAIH